MQNESSLNISVSIVCFNSSDAELRALLTSLIASIKKLRLKKDVSILPVYVVNNSEHQQLPLEIFADLSDQLRSQSIELNLVQGHGNIGYGKGHNLILKKVTSKYHLLLNPDVQVDEDCLEQGICLLYTSDAADEN